jgi:hypothetical protein
MAKKIDSYDFSTYKLGQYADGAIYELTRGEDFEVTPETLKTHARAFAQTEGLAGVDVDIIPEVNGTPARVVLRFRK